MSTKDQRTAVLCLEYMKLVDIIRKFIKGERTGNRSLHLQAVYDMLPYFAAACHNLYAKSAYRIYLIKCLWRLFNFLTLRVGAYSRWAFIKFSPFSASSKFIL